MPSKDWKPWWERSFNSPQEREEFIRGLSGARPSSNKSSDILLALVAGFVGGKAAQSRGDNEQR